MADYYVELRDEIVEEHYQVGKKSRTGRVASLDVFRGLSVFLMTFVDYAGPLLPSIGHSPWNGVHLADCVMPFFLFIVGVSLALVYKNVENRLQATYKAFLKAVQLFIIGMILQGGYFHGITSLTYGVDMESIRWLGILQRISLCYIVAALCEIWLPCRLRSDPMVFKRYYLSWCVALALCIVYSGLLYGLYVSDWQFKVSNLTSSIFSQNNTCIVYTVSGLLLFMIWCSTFFLLNHIF